MYINGYYFWADLIGSCGRPTFKYDKSSLYAYYLGINTVIRNLGVSKDVCDKLWDYSLTFAKENLYEEIICD